MLLIFFHDRNWLQPNNRITQVDSNYNHTSSPTPSTRITLSELPTKIPTGDTHQFEFLLFSYLLRFVHREGRLGDFARAGLIFLFDIAFLTPGEEGGENLSSGAVNNGPDPLQEARDALGEFILDGDFADVMAAALGAVYSLLPTKLQVPSISSQEMPEENIRNISSGGMHLGSGMVRQEEGDHFPLSTDLHVQTQLDLLLKLFGFLQDIIRRCNSPILHADPNSNAVTVTHVLGGAIVKAILDAIHSSFLDNVLYPSVLECSSHDGSSVAVLTYLDALFSNLDDGPIVDHVLSFLLDTELSDTPMTLPMVESKRERQETGAMRFVSQIPLKSTEYFASEGRFTLKDLILDNLCSEQPNSVTAALCLLRTLLSDHPNQATRALISYIHDPSATALVRNPIPRSLDLQSPDHISFLPKPVNFTDAHLQEVELYGTLLCRLDPSQTSIEMSPGYMGYLADMQTALESNPLFRLAQILPFTDEEDTDALNNGGKLDNDNLVPIAHKLSPADPLLRAVLFEFEKFLYKTADENVAMTGVLTAVALCPYRGLGGWLLYEKEQAENTSLQDDEPSTECCGSDISSSIHHLPPDDDRDPFVTRSSLDLPVIYQILRLLVKQISLLRNQVPQFDRLLNERRQGLLFADHLDEAMNIMLDVDQASAASVSVFGSPAKSGENLASSLLTRQKGRSSGLASSIKSFLTPKKKTGHQASTPGTPGSTTPGGVLGTVGTSGTPEPGRTPRRLGFGLGLTGFSGTPTKSPSPPLSSPIPPTSPTPPTPPTSSAVVSSPSLSSAEPAPSTSTATATAPPFMAHYDQTRQTVSVSLAHDDLIQKGILSSVTGPYACGPCGGGGGGGGKTEVWRWSRRAKRPDLNPSRLRGAGDALGVDDGLGEEEEWEGQGGRESERQQQQQQVSLSTVLDNCVILEEFLKETVALIVARRMLGIDQIGFI